MGVFKEKLLEELARRLMPAPDDPGKFAQSVEERSRYQSKIRTLRDRRQYVADLLKEYEKAYQQGLEEGILMRQIHLRQMLLKLPQTPETELASLTLVDLQAKVDELQQTAWDRKRDEK